MNTVSTKRWAVRALVFFLLWCVGFVIACIFGGCDFESPDVKFATGIIVYSVDGPEYDAVTVGENGIVKDCVIKSAAAFHYADGTLVDVGGLQFTTTNEFASKLVKTHGGTFWYDSSGCGVRSTSVTEESGFCEFTVWNTEWGVMYGTAAGRLAKGKRTPETSVANGGFSNWMDVRTNYAYLIPWYDNVKLPSGQVVRGGHYLSGGPPWNGSVSAAQIKPAPQEGVANMKTASETEFLANSGAFRPQNGVVVASTQWCMQVGPGGKGYGRPVDHLTALDHSNSDVIQYRSTPYYLSVQVSCAEPVDASLVGVELSCVLRCGSTERDIAARIHAVSDDGLRLIVHSDYIVPIDYRDYKASTAPTVLYDRWTSPVDANDLSADIHVSPMWDLEDPNAFDPNCINSTNVLMTRLKPERYVPVHCISVERNQRLTIDFVGQFPPELVLYVAKHWLTGNRTLDITGDGIVNMNDYPF